jgi:hypothetical protein
MIDRPPEPAREAHEAGERLREQRARWATVTVLAEWIRSVREENHFEDKIFGPIRGQ